MTDLTGISRTYEMESCRADLVLRNCHAVTLDARRPQGRTIYMGQGSILKVSSKDIERVLTSPSAQVIDCRGSTVIPAFHDAHCHILAYAESLLNIDLGPDRISSIEDIVNKIRQAAASTPPGQWIRCAGYNEFYLKEKRHPTGHDLDRATKAHPVKLTHRSGHAHVLNTPAMSLAGIGNESEEPPGCMIERDIVTGLPNGLLFGMGAYLSGAIPPGDAREMDTALKQAGQTLLGLGITSVQDASPGNGRARWRQFLDWKRKGIFLPRTILMFGAKEAGELPLYDAETGLASGAVKIMLDEVRGCLNPSQDELNRLVSGIHLRGLQIAIHAVEEPTVEAAINALSYAQRVLRDKTPRHRIEHCSICNMSTARRLRKLGASVVTNPAFIYYSGERYLSTVARHQLRHLYALETMLQAGLIAAAGSDAPVAPPDPFKGIYAAVTRRAESGQEVLKRESISVMDALRLYTSSAAWTCFWEKKAGSISKGKYADLAILNADPFGVKPQELKDIKVEMTVLAGKVACGTYPSRSRRFQDSF
jgi:predicted amidohydrolase YtcJ